MPTNAYLNKASKKYYTADFEKVLAFNNSEFWNLDPGLAETLKKINENPEIQTLYSKKYYLNPDSFAPSEESYLQIAFSKRVEPYLDKFLESFKNDFVSKNSTITIDKLEPSNNANYDPKSRFALGCIKNPDYFRIKHYNIQIESLDETDHAFFFETLRQLSLICRTHK